ncbi:MAG TPA: MupA/Atu3671 family FMN-dependent luciferase-like monooxygenase [Ktedonobacteraceae bacterium]|nr:MupA/Atu3671 family FMN-dependent luciferase-like monooxygenase [Ktedonobacteraceae bacterium]
MMDLSIMFFASQTQVETEQPYRLVLEAAKFADTHNFCAVWTPERHFADFGGIFPNPSVLSAALAVLTTNLQIRAGSVVAPLHDSIRIAEEWALVDNLSHGRVAISFGSGWNINDFVLFPERYDQRRQFMHRQIEEIQALWRGEGLTRKNSKGIPFEVRLYPRPVQQQLPVWISASSSITTFEYAGSIGANVLTHFISQDTTLLAEKIRAYRASRHRHGFEPQAGIITLMLHTFLGQEDSVVKALVRPHLREYLRSAVLLENNSASGGGTISGGFQVAPQDLEPDLLEEMLDITFERYYNGYSLLGTVKSCLPRVRHLESIGVNEIACLIDFGVEVEQVLEALDPLNDLRQIVQGKEGRND